MTVMKISAATIRKFQEVIWEYYKKHGREFPWRPRSPAAGGRTRGTGELDPYGVLISEVMLQQTQVDRVIPKYIAWMKQFPTPTALAHAATGDVVKAWQGLGYNRRALNLKRATEVIVREYGGEVPRDVEKLDALPGVGPYTAAAILAFAWNERVVFIETNIRTVYLYFFFKGRKKVQDKKILEVVARTLPDYHPSSPLLRKEGKKKTSVREWYNALMDYGAMLKAWYGNPNVRSAHYAKQKKFAGSRRELRGKILRRAARQKTIVPGEFASDAFSVPEVLRELVREGFLRREGRVFKLQ